MKPRATFVSQSGYNFFLVMTKIGGLNNWKPVYKSEITQFNKGAFEWNLVNFGLQGNIETEFKIEFF